VKEQNSQLNGVVADGQFLGQGARKKIPKMASVVGILGHLASKHQQDIRKALMALFEVRFRSLKLDGI